MTIAAKFLEVQNELNLKLSPEWKEKGWNYCDAMFTEATEAFNHLNWEWWRATDRVIDWDQVKLEWVDVGHFMFSEIMANGYEEDFIKQINYAIQDEKEYDFVEGAMNVDRVKRGLKAFTQAVLKYDLEGRDPVYFADVLDIFIANIWKLGLTIPQFYTLFIGKVCLNQLRWKNGYKKGIYGAQDVSTPEFYIKTWEGVEDNVWLAQYAATLNPKSETFRQELTAGLEARYAEVYRTAWEIRDFDDVV
jgi:hypothetical protein